MYKRIHFLILIKKFSTNNILIRNNFIRNKAGPICSNCLYFIDPINNYTYPSKEKYGRCKKFGEVNLVIGMIEYDFAYNCRLNENKCGKLGLEFNEK